VDKVQVKIITDPELHAEWLEKAREAYDERNQRLADMTDERCRSSTPAPVPELCARPRLRRQSRAAGPVRRLQLAGLQGQLPDQPDRPQPADPKGNAIDRSRAYWTGSPTSLRSGLPRRVSRWTMYSIMENPMTACGCFECIMMMMPEANGFMVVSREDPA
jgi:acetyl-CoA synthase